MSELIDIVGLGALNRDFIVEWAQVRESERARVRSSLHDVERCTDNLASFQSTLRKTLAATNDVGRTYGGSAFNTMKAIAKLRLDLSVGYVSVLGVPPLKEECDMWGAAPDLATGAIDGQAILETESETGACLSLVDDDGNRDLFTYFNDSLAQNLADDGHRSFLVAYLARARHIHVSSVLGEWGPRCILDLINAARDTAGHTISVSVDPGRLWAELPASSMREDVLSVIGVADLVFVNDDELKRLGQSHDTSDAIETLGATIGTESVVVVLKQWDRAVVIRDGGTISDVAPQLGLPSPRIADATGAGDVFAAGFLASRLSRRGNDLGDALVGLTAARQKLQAFADTGYERLTTVFKAQRVEEGGIFVSHAASDDELARGFVTLLTATGVPRDRIFSIGVPGVDIPFGSKWLPEVAHRLSTANLIVSLVTPAFLDSEFCAYETGAGWILGKPHWCLLSNNVDPAQLGPLRSSVQASSLTNGAKVRQLRSEVTRAGLAPSPSDADWPGHWQEFMDGFT